MHLFHSTVVAALLSWLSFARSEVAFPDDNSARRVGGPLWDPRTYSPDDAPNEQQPQTTLSAATDSVQRQRHLQAGCGVYPNPVRLVHIFALVGAVQQKI
jgi:hypothetical protein